MADKVEMSLDDFIKNNRQKFRFNTRRRGRGGAGAGGGGSGGVRGGRIQRRGGRGGLARNRRSNFGRGQLFEKSGDVNGPWQHDRFEGRRGPAGGVGGVGKLLVSNLDFGVSNSDINELFSEFGRLRSATVHYDRSGRSLGTADVVFERRADAISAMKQYNGVPLDGRPMNIQLTTSDIGGGGGGGNPARGRRTPRGFGGRGRGRPGRGARGGSAGARAKISAESLDAELDDYIKSK